MLGALFGDIVGSVYEWHNIHTKEFPLLVDHSRFTDDTVMSIAVCDAFLEGMDHHYDDNQLKETLIKKMREYGRKYPGRGFGGMFAQWLVASDPKPYNSFGNGSAMRVSSVGWLYNSLEEVNHYAKISAEVTHNHVEGIKGAQAIASSIYLARQKKSKEEILEYIKQTYGYNVDESLDEIRKYYSFNVTCQGSVPQAIRAFYESTGYEDALRSAISIGGDSDTIACMTGGIAEAYYGMPKHLQDLALSKLDPDLITIINRFQDKVII